MFSCCLWTENLMKPLERNRTGANWPVKYPTSQESNHQTNSNLWTKSAEAEMSVQHQLLGPESRPVVE